MHTSADTVVIAAPSKPVDLYGGLWERFCNTVANQAHNDADFGEREYVVDELVDSLPAELFNFPEGFSRAYALAVHHTGVAKHWRDYQVKSDNWRAADDAVAALYGMIEQAAADEHSGTPRMFFVRAGWAGVLDQWNQSRYFRAEEWFRSHGGAEAGVA